jgi:hypothetical protein
LSLLPKDLEEEEEEEDEEEEDEEEEEEGGCSVFCLCCNWLRFFE